MTNDVPGANKNNADELAVGCWAEADDGSLILVKGLENGTVIYEIFDSANPDLSFTDAMPEKKFKPFYSYAGAAANKVKWSWHDKTSFPWDRVMKNISRPKPGFSSVEAQMSAAQRVMESLKKMGHDLKGRKLSKETIAHEEEQVYPKGAAIMQKLAEALEILTS
jgi:hypothetical protein